MNFLDIAQPTNTNTFESTTGINPIIFGIVLGVIVVIFAVVFIVDRKNKGQQ